MVLAVCLCSQFVISANAVTTYLDVTVTRDMKGEDAYSIKTRKDGGALWDNKFYVTNRTFSGEGSISFMSFYSGNANLNSYVVKQSNTSKGATRSNSYKFDTSRYQDAYFYACSLHMSESKDYRLRLTGAYCP